MTNFNNAQPERDSSGEPTGYKSEYQSPSAQSIAALTKQGVDLEHAIALLDNNMLISVFVDMYRTKGINIEPSTLPHLIRAYLQDKHRSNSKGGSAEA